MASQDAVCRWKYYWKAAEQESPLLLSYFLAALVALIACEV